MAETAAQPPTTSEERMKPLLDRYELGRVLGHGNFAKVYHGRDIRTGESVAIKALDKERILKSGLAAHIKREVAILRRVRHPNIVRLHEVMASKSKIYLVMELVRGGELFAKVAKGRLQEPIARRYFHQLISAVAFCHARGVYHRDLKPENLLLDHNGDLKVTDFGLSAVKEQIHRDGLFHTFCGTPAYVAPEILSRRGYDAAKADIWSCGIILFVLMAGYLPFYDTNVMSMYRKIHKGEFRCPRWFSGDLARLLARILDTNPETRITIPEIMESRWFKKGFKPIRFYVEDDKVHSFEDAPEEPSDMDYDSDSSAASVASAPPLDGRGGRALPRPMSLNAFDIISFSRGFDLSPLFDGSGDGARFVSGAPLNKIVSKLEEIAKLVSFTVRKKECRVNLEGSQDGENGPLSIAAEIYELTPELVMVEVKKNSGDQVEYENFCNNRLKPELQKLMGRAASIYSDTE